MTKGELKNIIKEVIEEAYMNSSKKRWCAVVIDDESRKKLLNLLKSHYPDVVKDNWELVAHHMTIDPFKPLGANDVDKLGKKYKLSVTDIGCSDKACAVKVTGYDEKTNNEFAHITLAVNRVGGGKPKDSNSISKWKPLHITDQIELNGVAENL